MTKLDRYIARQFWQTFFICFCSLTGLYIVIDGFGNLEDFISYSKDHGGLLKVMGEYYSYRALSFFDITSGILSLIAAMFTITWAQRHQEMTAIEAAGIPPRRVLRPIFTAVVVILALAAVNREAVIPQFRDQLSHNLQDLSQSQGKPLKSCYDHATGVLFIQGQTYPDPQRINKAEFNLPRKLQLDITSVGCQDAFCRPAENGHPQGYLLFGVEPKELTQMPSIMLDQRPLLLTPQDTAWLEPGQAFLVSDVSFERLETGSDWQRYCSTAQLITGLRNPSLALGPDVRTTIHSRILQPLLDFTLVLLGLPLVLKRGNQNVFLAIGLCAAVVAGFMVITLACQTVLGAGALVSPALAAWCPLLLCAPLAMGMSQPLFE